MKIRSLLIGLGVMAAMAVPVCAETITTEDGVLSVETPSEGWKQMADPNYWFVLSDGKNTITVDHLSNGEKLPAVDVAGSGYDAVYQAFVSTKNEVFIVKGLAATQEDLAAMMQTIGTIKVLKYDTKTAISKETEAAASQFGLTPINATYYVTTDELNVRNGCSTDEAILGVLTYGAQVTVNGSVTKDGADFGWYQIQYNGAVAYVSAGFLSQTQPAAKASGKSETKADANASSSNSTGKTAVGAGLDVYRADGSYAGYLVPYSDGQYYIDGNIPFSSNGDGSFFGGAGAGMTVYSKAYIDAMNNPENPSGQENVQCEYCGEWFVAGNDYRNHVAAAHPEASATDDTGVYNSELVQCEYCGEWFEAGNDYRNHVAAAHPGQ